MLTPAFELEQDAEFLKILIKARYAKVAEVEIFVEGNDFKFYAKPYFLRLQLPGRVVEDGREKAKYDVDTGSFEIKFPKETPGEVFEGLDMLTKLLAPRGQRSAEQPGIELIGESQDAEQTEDGDSQEEIDWQVEQKPFQQEEDSLLGETFYGFANKRSGVFQRLQEELCDIVDVPNPDKTQLLERRLARECAENEKFDGDHYLADLYQDDTAIGELLAHKPPWHQEWRILQAKSKLASSHDETVYGDEQIVLFTEDEKEQMRKLPNRHHLLDAESEKGALLSLVDIIFGYAYNVRTMLSENSVESAWTICKLSPTLSWLDWFTSPEEVMIACHRRALCYPLYRHWELTSKVFQDVKRIFLLGRRRLLKCLLEVHRILAADEPHYILNELYITDYCVWVQSLSQHKIASLAQALKKVKVSKSKIGFELEELEQAAELAQQEADQEQNEEGAGSAVHQYGYPHILHKVSDNESTHRKGAKLSAAATQEDSKVMTCDSGAENISDGCHSSKTVTKESQTTAACIPVEESSVDQVTDTLSALKLHRKNSEPASSLEEKQVDSISHSGSTLPLSLEEWSMRPPSRKIEVFGEDMTNPNSEGHADFRKGTKKLEDKTNGDANKSDQCDITSTRCSPSTTKCNNEMLGLECGPNVEHHSCHPGSNSGESDQGSTRNQLEDSEKHQEYCQLKNGRSDPQANVDSDSESEFGSQSASNSESGSDSQSGSNSQSNSSSQSDSKSDSESDSELELKPDLEPNP